MFSNDVVLIILRNAQLWCRLARKRERNIMPLVL